MKLEFYSSLDEKKAQKITKENWDLLWQPKKIEQWKDGRSSKEFSKYAATESFKELITKVLNDCGINMQDFKCVPEAKNSLGKGFNPGCRNHDLLMIGKDCVIGIEAKVSEGFGNNNLDVEIEEQKKKYNNKKEKTRAYKLLDYVASGNKSALNIGYQLFTATRGTISSALESNFTKCILLILVFDGDVIQETKYSEHIKKNNDDFDKFIKVIGADNKGHLLLKKDTEPEVDIWIKKSVVHVSNSYNFT